MDIQTFDTTVRNTQLSDVPSPGPIDPPASGSSRTNVGDAERIASVLGGALLSFFGIKEIAEEKQLTTGGMVLALAGGALLFRGTTGYCPVNQAFDRDSSTSQAKPIEMIRTVTVNKPRAEVYAFWRQLENLPHFMQYLSEVKQLDERRSHWKAKIPGNVGTLEWDAEILVEEENERIVWRSIPGATVDNAGEVRFKDAPGDWGTEVQAFISYRPPAGYVGKGAASLFSPVFEQLVKEDLRRFKQVMETGEIPTIEGQPSAHQLKPVLTRFFSN